MCDELSVLHVLRNLLALLGIMSNESSDNASLWESLFGSAVDPRGYEVSQFGCVLPDQSLAQHRLSSSVGSGLDLAGNERTSGMDGRRAPGRER